LDRLHALSVRYLHGMAKMKRTSESGNALYSSAAPNRSVLQDTEWFESRTISRLFTTERAESTDTEERSRVSGSEPFHSHWPLRSLCLCGFFLSSLLDRALDGSCREERDGATRTPGFPK
jgi:hypothetical protein